MAGAEAQTPPPVRAPNGSGLFEINDSNASAASSASSRGSSAVDDRTLQEHRNGDVAISDKVDRTSKAVTASSTSGTPATTPSGGGGGGGRKLTSTIEGGDASEDYGDLAHFVAVACDKDRQGHNQLALYDAGIDIPLPRRHPEVVRARAAKLAAGRKRAELNVSEVGTEESTYILYLVQQR